MLRGLGLSVPMQPTRVYMHFQKIPNAIMLSLMVPLLMSLMFMLFGFSLKSADCHECLEGLGVSAPMQPTRLYMHLKFPNVKMLSIVVPLPMFLMFMAVVFSLNFS